MNGFTRYPERRLYYYPEFEVNHTGKLSGVPSNNIRVLGCRENWSSSSLQCDVACYLGAGQQKYNIPSSATTYYIVSTSVQDATGGTGVDKVKIIYLDANGLEATTVVTLNGTTAVSIGTGFGFIQWMESYHSVTSDREAAGDISITSNNGAAAEANTIEQIQAGNNRSLSGRYKVPSDRHAHLNSYHVSTAKLGAASTFDVALRATVFNDDGSLSNAYHFMAGVVLQDGQVHSEDLHYVELPANALVKFSIVSSDTTSAKAYVTLDLILMDGED